MTKKETISAIFDRLTPLLESEGFKLDSKNQYYLKNTKEALFNYDIRFYDRTVAKTGERGFLIEPVVYINVKAIEDIYKQITVNKYLTKPVDFITLGGNVANLEANPDGLRQKWDQSLDLLVFESSDVDYVAGQLLHHFSKTALPYCLESGNIAGVDRLLNKNPDQYTVHMANETYRIIKGLIAAKLVNNPRLGDLVLTYERIIQDWELPVETQQEFDRVIAVLPELNEGVRLKNRF
ncbi:hypothetical protein [Chitinophaga ginsengisoli]|uniref:Uncharacterized protein n=1 Tax=Chitinophaga ginsengisoli TaxID=363837 RepID=A0A2P8FDV7_9BACT|nr:hypothetical protein [Chitinophaga ginsengisoli]PSL19896.1 hypothetical protein CLV42_1268 [Chitinophaga ginsengisoli]